jgi:hypothetical protein
MKEKCLPVIGNKENLSKFLFLVGGFRLSELGAQNQNYRKGNT